jgi:hypothetical protein
MLRKTLSFLGTKIGIALILSVVVVSSAFALKYAHFGEGRSAQSDQLIATTDAVKQSFEKDTDNDGLKDWEEGLYGTDPKNPDTKGTGLGDAKEVEKIKAQEAADAKGTTPATASTTATDRLSRELLTKYFEAKKAGLDITPELSSRIAEEVLSKDYDVELPPFDDSVLNTSPSTDARFIHTYGNSLASVILTPLPENTSNELIILQEIIDQGTPSEENIADIDKIIDRYTTMRDKLVSMIVPTGAKDGHAQIIQGLELIRNSVLGIKSLQTDPVGALPKIALYEDGVTILDMGSIVLKQYFKKQGAVFGPGEIAARLMP